ncbi:hypothetical protein RHSIM_Rhsim09G0070700 [Rhododendron simsii]|uniref:GAG-pre-integrase domain-containing protein n=1 Tax=Rhododendron simsii TaxID=118357 RepID=A0A834GDP4_RHOSS|nr:hypothetical protein RHSIM_Rhsim09G0070700 [Rhododendron simsii]
MPEHLRVMSAMIRDLRTAGSIWTDEQQILAMLMSLPDETWDHFKLTMTHNEMVKTFNDLKCHLELEAERQDVKRGNEVLVVEPGQRKTIGSTRRRQGNKPFGHGSISGGIYVLDLDGLNKNAFMAFHDDNVISSSVKWHAKLGHIGQDRMTRFLQCLDTGPRSSGLVTLYCDSTVALAYTKDPKYHGKSKHIDIWFHYIRDMVA